MMSIRTHTPPRLRRIVSGLVAAGLAAFLSLGLAAPAHASDNYPGGPRPHPSGDNQNQQ